MSARGPGGRCATWCRTPWRATSSVTGCMMRAGGVRELPATGVLGAAARAEQFDLRGTGETGLSLAYNRACYTAARRGADAPALQRAGVQPGVPPRARRRLRHRLLDRLVRLARRGATRAWTSPQVSVDRLAARYPDAALRARRRERRRARRAIRPRERLRRALPRHRRRASGQAAVRCSPAAVAPGRAPARHRRVLRPRLAWPSTTSMRPARALSSR